MVCALISCNKMSNTFLPSTINSKCNDGFCNQLRMVLAGIVLVQEGYVKEYNQEWTNTNHNNVNFLDFYETPSFINLKKISNKEVNWVDGTFAGMTGKFIEKNGKKWPLNLIKAFKTLKLKNHIQKIVDEYCESIKCKNLLGLHVRRTCKIGVNKLFPKRVNHLLTNQEYLDIIKDYNLNVFVATDNKQTQDYFKKNLGKRCYVYKDLLEGREDYCNEQYTREKVKRFSNPLHTIIDFYTLLNCKRFIGTESSSFTALIYHLRGNNNDYRVISGC